MTTLEKVKKYIRDTKVPEPVAYRYVLRVDEAESFAKLDIYDGMALAFAYGRAKGYRAARAAGTRV